MVLFHKVHLYLLQFNSLCELLAEGEVGDGNVVENDAELARSLCQFLTHFLTDKLSLSDELSRVKLSYHSFKDLCCDGWQYTVIVVHPENCVDLRKLIRDGPEQNTQGNVHVL